MDITAENIYSENIENAVVICAAYKADEMAALDTENIENLGSGATEPLNFTLNGEDFDFVKVFAVEQLNNPVAVSECKEFKLTGNEKISEKIESAVVGDKLNIAATYDTQNKILHISTGLNEERTQNAVIILLSADNGIKFAWMGNTDENSNIGVNFKIENDGNLSDPYTIYASVGQNFAKIGDTVTYLYSEDDRKIALKAVEEATADDAENLILKSDYKIIYQIDGTEYNKLSPKSKTEVLNAVAGKTFDDIADIRTAWNKKVEYQAVTDAMTVANAADGVTLLEQNAELLNLDINGMYSKLSSEAKEQLFSEYFKDKGIVNDEAVKKAFADGERLITLKTLTAAEIADNEIIENYHEYLQIKKSDYDYFNGLEKSNRYIVIQSFKTKIGSVYAAENIGSVFESAVDEFKKQNSSSSPNGRPSSSGGGGGSSYSTSASYTAVQPIKKEDIVSDLVDENGNYSFFNDVSKDAWYYNAVRTLKSKNIIDGTANNNFEADNFITREEFVKMVVLAFDMYNNGAETLFVDTQPVFWHYRYIASAQVAGIINGINEREFGVGAHMTREEMAVIINRTIAYKNIKPNAENTEIKVFTDEHTASDWAKESIENLKNYGYMNGFEDGTFRPAEAVSRAMAAQTIYNIIK